METFHETTQPVDVFGTQAQEDVARFLLPATFEFSAPGME
jgi:hypothetical protein